MAADTSSLSNVLQLMQMFSGKGNTTTTSGGTSTKQTQLSPDIMAQILKQGLESNQGLAEVASGQNKSGMYNSTTNTMLTNDLLARLTTNAAIAGAPTVTTTPKTVQQVTTPSLASGSGLAGLGVLAGTALFKPEIDKALGAQGKGGVIGNARKLVGLDKAEVPAASVANNASSIANSADINAASMAPAVSASSVDVANSADLASQAFSGASSAADSFLSAGADAAIGGAGAGAEAISESVGSSIANAVANSADDAAENFAGDAVGSVLDACFITTAVCKYRGKPDNCYELETLRGFRDTWLAKYKPDEVREYYEKAPAIVAKLEVKPESADIFNFLYSVYILPALDNIARKDYLGAYAIYRNMFRFCDAI